MRFQTMHLGLGRATVLALAFCGCASVISPARASYIVTYAEVGSDVVATGAGSIDTTDLTDESDFFIGALVVPEFALAVTGSPDAVTGQDWGDISGPTSLGAAGVSPATAGDGDTVGVEGAGNFLLLPDAYVSGSALSSTATFGGQTFDTLGLTPGTYTWTWGTGADADSFVVQIGPLPEPSSLLLSVVPLAFLARRGWRRGVLAR